MKSWLSLRTALALSFLASYLAITQPAQAEKRVALVIGNNDYKNVPKLQKAVNDARTMGDTLKQLGFSVMVAENQTRQAFSQTLLAFDAALEPGDTAFFFYAGHGFEIAGQNFLLPTDVPAAGEGQEELVRDASVLADRIIERLQNKNVRTAILVFDACRNNPFERSGTRARRRRRRPRADDATAGGRILGIFSRSPSDRARPSCRTTTTIPIRCSREPSRKNCCSPAKTWCRSPNTPAGWSARWRRP